MQKILITSEVYFNWNTTEKGLSVNKDVPKALVETWISLARNKELSKEIQTRALQNLTNTLGSVEAIAAYMKQHNIK